MPKKTLNLIEQTGNDALIQVKRNQPTLFDTLTGWAHAAPAAQTHHTTDIGRRNRNESRKATVWQLPRDLTDSLAEWPRMCCLLRIERSTDVFNPGQRHWKRRQETAWYICTRALTAEPASATVRSHWGIENAFHHVRDVAMCEDASHIRKQPGTFARLRSWALNLIRISGTQHIYATRQTLGWDAQAAWNCLTAYDEK